MDEETLFYIRTADGATYYVKTLDDAIREFVSKDGYRMSIKVTDGTEIVIRREQDPSEHDPLGNDVFSANITVRRKET